MGLFHNNTASILGSAGFAKWTCTGTLTLVKMRSTLSRETIPFVKHVFTEKESQKPTRCSGGLESIWPVKGAAHDVTELAIYLSKGFGFVRQLTLNVGGGKNALQIHPVLLASHPLLKRCCKQP